MCTRQFMRGLSKTQLTMKMLLCRKIRISLVLRSAARAICLMGQCGCWSGVILTLHRIRSEALTSYPMLELNTLIGYMILQQFSNHGPNCFGSSKSGSCEAVGDLTHSVAWYSWLYMNNLIFFFLLSFQNGSFQTEVAFSEGLI